MAFFQTLGDLAPSDWNSTKYPGVCKPTNFTSLGLFQELQMQLNRLADHMGLKKVGVDGDLGPGTLKLLAQCKAKGLGMPFPIDTCSQVAKTAVQITTILRGTADSFGVPAKVSAPAVWHPATIVTPAGDEVKAPEEFQRNASPGLSGALGGAGTVVAIGALGAIVYMLHKDRKGARGKSARGRSMRRSRRSRRSRRR